MHPHPALQALALLHTCPAYQALALFPTPAPPHPALQALALFPGRELIWREAAQLEMSHGQPQQVEERLQRGVKYCPQVGRL